MLNKYSIPFRAKSVVMQKWPVSVQVTTAKVECNSSTSHLPQYLFFQYRDPTLPPSPLILDDACFAYTVSFSQKVSNIYFLKNFIPVVDIKIIVFSAPAYSQVSLKFF